MKYSFKIVATISILITFAYSCDKPNYQSQETITNIPLFSSAQPLFMTFSDDVGYVTSSEDITYKTCLIAKTIDGGRTWITSPLKVEGEAVFNVNSIFAVDKDTIFLSILNCHNGRSFCKSTDGAKTWKFTGRLPVDNNLFGGIFFFNSKIGFVSGAESIWKTYDGGFTWSKVFNSAPVGIFFVNDSVDYSYVSSPLFEVLLKTVDKGESWSKISSPKGLLDEVIFISESTGYVFTESKKVFQTLDGGRSWTFLNYLDETNGHYSAVFHE